MAESPLRDNSVYHITPWKPHGAGSYNVISNTPTIHSVSDKNRLMVLLFGNSPTHGVFC